MCCLSKKKGEHYQFENKYCILKLYTKFSIYPKEFKTQNLQHDTTLKSNRK